jgi:hypothetical protein
MMGCIHQIAGMQPRKPQPVNAFSAQNKASLGVLRRKKHIRGVCSMRLAKRPVLLLLEESLEDAVDPLAGVAVRRELLRLEQ